jgi:hypothetical protein
VIILGRFKTWTGLIAIISPRLGVARTIARDDLILLVSSRGVLLKSVGAACDDVSPMPNHRQA